MNKDITEEILLKAGFQKNRFSFYIQGSNPIDIYYTSFPVSGRHWDCFVYSDEKFTSLLADIYIQTIDHFNKLMELMNIDLRL